MHCFILAGGFATRLWPLTERRAKPLLPLLGTPMLSHLVEQVPLDIPVTVSTNAAFADAFHAWRPTLNRDGVDVAIEHTRSDDEKLGALGATAQWIRDRKIDDDLLILTGDNYCGFRLADMLQHARPQRALVAAHDIGDRERAMQFGTVILGENDGHPHVHPVAGFEEKPAEPKTTLVSTGFSILPKQGIPILLAEADRRPDNLGSLFEALLREGMGVDCFAFQEPWFDIGSFHAYLDATRALLGHAVHANTTASIEETKCEGAVVVGAHSRIRGSTLEDVVIFDDCVIEDCVLRDCVIDDGCELRGVDLTGKMIRARTTLKRS